jgi:hypothetical protein
MTRDRTRFRSASSPWKDLSADALACRAQEPRIGPVTRSFFEFARPAAPPRRRRGILTVHRARHLFPEHCLATPAPCLTSGLREGSFSHHGNSLRVPDQRNGARGEPLVRATIGISAPFRRSPSSAGSLRRRPFWEDHPAPAEPRRRSPRQRSASPDRDGQTPMAPRAHGRVPREAGGGGKVKAGDRPVLEALRRARGLPSANVASFVRLETLLTATRESG